MLEQEEFLSFISDILRKARRDKGYTLETLAEKSGLDYSTVNLIENGKQNPKIYTIYKLFHVLGVDFAALLGERNEEIDKKKAIIERLTVKNLETLESVEEFLEKFQISKKI